MMGPLVPRIISSCLSERKSAFPFGGNAPRVASVPCLPGITTHEGKKIAWFAGDGASLPDGPVGELRENVIMTTAEPGYEQVSPLQIPAVGTCDVTAGDVGVVGAAD
jgi:hypothetical protein